MNQVNPVVVNPNDFKVVSFHNSEEFGFTPEMGCMYDGRPINGITGAPGINAGETITLPYHIGHRLAVNLAKISLLRKAPEIDKAGIPTGVVLWDTVKLESIKELYSEAKPLVQSQTDLLMAKVEEYKKMVETLINKDAPAVKPVEAVTTEAIVAPAEPKTFQDKAEVIAELTKRGIKFDARKNKNDLEKLLA